MNRDYYMAVEDIPLSRTDDIEAITIQEEATVPIDIVREFFLRYQYRSMGAVHSFASFWSIEHDMRSRLRHR